MTSNISRNSQLTNARYPHRNRSLSPTIRTSNVTRYATLEHSESSTDIISNITRRRDLEVSESLNSENYVREVPMVSSIKRHTINQPASLQAQFQTNNQTQASITPLRMPTRRESI